MFTPTDSFRTIALQESIKLFSIFIFVQESKKPTFAKDRQGDTIFSIVLPVRNHQGK
jgi:hypothetical protein